MYSKRFVAPLHRVKALSCVMAMVRPTLLPVSCSQRRHRHRRQLLAGVDGACGRMLLLLVRRWGRERPAAAAGPAVGGGKAGACGQLLLLERR